MLFRCARHPFVKRSMLHTIKDHIFSLTHSIVETKVVKRNNNKAHQHCKIFRRQGEKIIEKTLQKLHLPCLKCDFQTARTFRLFGPTLFRSKEQNPQETLTIAVLRKLGVGRCSDAKNSADSSGKRTFEF